MDNLTRAAPTMTAAAARKYLENQYSAQARLLVANMGELESRSLHATHALAEALFDASKHVRHIWARELHNATEISDSGSDNADDEGSTADAPHGGLEDDWELVPLLLRRAERLYQDAELAAQGLLGAGAGLRHLRMQQDTLARCSDSTALVRARDEAGLARELAEEMDQAAHRMAPPGCDCWDRASEMGSESDGLEDISEAGTPDGRVTMPIREGGPVKAAPPKRRE